MLTLQCKASLARLLAATAVVVAALVLAPSLASAHPGHSHSVVAAEKSIEFFTQPVLIEVALDAAQDEVTIGEITDQSSSLLPASSQKTPQSCPGGCCHSAGTGCCAASIPDAFEIVAPPLGHLALAVEAVRISGVTPGALPEPPNSLV